MWSCPIQVADQEAASIHHDSRISSCKWAEITSDGEKSLVDSKCDENPCSSLWVTHNILFYIPSSLYTTFSFTQRHVSLVTTASLLSSNLFLSTEASPIFSLLFSSLFSFLLSSLQHIFLHTCYQSCPWEFGSKDVSRPVPMEPHPSILLNFIILNIVLSFSTHIFIPWFPSALFLSPKILFCFLNFIPYFFRTFILLSFVFLS